MAFETTAAPGAKPKTPSASVDSAPFTGPSYITPVGGPTTTTTTPDPVTTTPQFPGIQNVLGTDPMYEQFLSFDKAASAEDLATMNRNMAQMKAYYGSDTDPLSLLGRVFQAYQDRNRTIANTLAGHGMINSGETGFQGARATLSYQQQEYDAKFKLQQYIQGMQDSFRAAERQRKINEMTAAQNAVTSWIQNNQPTVTQPPDVTTTTYPDIPAADLAANAIARQKGNEMGGM